MLDEHAGEVSKEALQPQSAGEVTAATQAGQTAPEPPAQADVIAEGQTIRQAASQPPITPGVIMEGQVTPAQAEGQPDASAVATPAAGVEEFSRAHGGGRMIVLSIFAFLAYLTSNVMYYLPSYLTGQGAWAAEQGNFIIQVITDAIYTLPIFMVACAKPWQGTGKAERVFLLLPLLACVYNLVYAIGGIGSYNFPTFTSDLADLPSYIDYALLITDLSMVLLIAALILLAVAPGRVAALLTTLCFVLEGLAVVYFLAIYLPLGIGQLLNNYADAFKESVAVAISFLFYLVGVVCYYSALLTYRGMKKRLAEKAA